MDLVLGIDTGGTYTDAVLLAPGARTPLATGKALTTPRDLGRGIVAAIDLLDPPLLRRVRRVCLSTTLATNAVVEGKGARVFLLLLGHHSATIERFGLTAALPDVGHVLLPGRMGQRGEELVPLDEAAVRRVAEEESPHADAFAISGYFATKNPAHELRARDIIQQVCDKPVVCGSELSSRLNCMRRAATSVINAQLLPIVRDLIEGVTRALEERGISGAEVLVMRGDGSLMPVAAAYARPIETTMSGPAASAVGARFLAGVADAIVVDMGGTTTDLAVLVDGEPRVHDDGATVGGFRTHVRACDMATTGLGGDSHLRAGIAGEILIGPRRAVPLALAARQFERRITPILRAAACDPKRARGRFAAEFVLPTERVPAVDWTERERRVLDAVADGPLSLPDLAERLDALDPSLLPLERLESTGAVQRAAMTPTDVLLACGRLTLHDPAASRLGTQLLADRLGLDPAALAERVIDSIGERIALFTLRHALDGLLPAGLTSEQTDAILRAALAPPPSGGVGALAASVSLPVIAIGAPVREYFPAAVAKMRAELVIPDSAEVANAVGAAVGRVRCVVEIDVRPVYEGMALSHYAVHSSEELSEWPSLEEALTRAELVGRRIALRELHGRLQGNDGVLVESRHVQKTAVANGADVEVLMGVLVRTTAWLPDVFNSEGTT